MQFGDYVKTLKKKGVNQSDVAEQLGKARCTINRWCTGKTIPEPDDIKAVAKWSKNRVKLTDWYK